MISSGSCGLELFFLSLPFLSSLYNVFPLYPQSVLFPSLPPFIHSLRLSLIRFLNFFNFLFLFPSLLSFIHSFILSPSPAVVFVSLISCFFSYSPSPSACYCYSSLILIKALPRLYRNLFSLCRSFLSFLHYFPCCSFTSPHLLFSLSLLFCPHFPPFPSLFTSSSVSSPLLFSHCLSIHTFPPFFRSLSFSLYLHLILSLTHPSLPAMCLFTFSALTHSYFSTVSPPFSTLSPSPYISPTRPYPAADERLIRLHNKELFS